MVFVALLPASELAGLVETAHLLRSPANAEGLLPTLERSTKRKTRAMEVAKLRREMLGECEEEG